MRRGLLLGTLALCLALSAVCFVSIAIPRGNASSSVSIGIHVVPKTLERQASHPHPRRSVPTDWRTHHIFNGSRQLDDCPLAWPPHLQLWGPAKQSSETVELGKVLPFTLEALEAVWRHQHPRHCANASYLVFHSTPSGIGSVLHVMTAALRGALDSGRVLIEAPGHFLAPASYCGVNQTLDTCYFLPITNCSLTAAELAAAPLITGTNGYQRILARDAALPRVIRVGSEALHTFVDSPTMFEGLLNATSIPPGKWIEGSKHRMHWWRAIGVAYLIRPNARTAAELEARRHTKLVGGEMTSGCVGLYIRHGDKHRENEIFTNQQYEAAVAQIRRIDTLLTRQIFLSTEDGATIAFFRNTSGGWLTSYVDMPMKNDPQVSNLEYMARHGYNEEVLNGLLNLQLILACDGFVGSIFFELGTVNRRVAVDSLVQGTNNVF